MRQADVIVIGAGVLGTFHAYFAALKGYKTLLIERAAFPNDASARNFGIIAPSIVPVGGEWASFARDTIALYRSLQQEHDITAQVTGSLYLASTEPERRVLEEFARAFSAGYACVYLDAAEARYRYPFIRESYCAGALLFPDDLTLAPRQMLRRLIPYLARQGLIDYLPGANVVSVESTGSGCIVRDARGVAYAAGRVIVCNGADYRTLFPAVFAASGLRLCKLQMMQTEPRPAGPAGTLPHAVLSGLSIRRYSAFASCPSYPLLCEQPVAQQIRDYGIHVLFKQLPDGAVVIGDSHEYSGIDGTSMDEAATNPRIDQAILRYGQDMLTLPSWDIRRRWNGYYLAHPEREIYTATIDGVIHIVTGIGGKGMTTGPGFARRHVDVALA